VFTSVIIILLGTAVLNLNEPFIRIRFNIVFCNVLIYLKSAEAALFVETLSGDTRPNFYFYYSVESVKCIHVVLALWEATKILHLI
jgi:hypothetical protein